MNLSGCRLSVILMLCAIGAATNSAKGQDPHGTQVQSTTSHSPDPGLLDLIRRTQDLAEESRAELKRSREQNEILQHLLEQTHRELIQIRQELTLLRSGTGTTRVAAIPANPEVLSPEITDQKPGTSAHTEGNESGLESRLSRIEDQADITSAQIREQAQTKLESESRFKVRLFGTLLSNTYFNTSDRSNEASPTVAPSRAASEDGSTGNFGATLRQTTFGFAMTGPRIGQARLSADVDFDFYGESTRAYGGEVLGALRMRTASIRLEGSRTSVIAGLMSPLVSPLNPTSLASVYYPALSESGNLWQWRPQFVVERRTPLAEGEDLVVQGGLLMPFGDRIGTTVLDGRPGYESRVAFVRRFDPDRRAEIGAGVYLQPQRFTLDRSLNSYATTADWVFPLGGRLELSGEAYYGRSISLGEQGGFDISDFYAISGPLEDPLSTIRGIHSIGGWAQVRARASSTLDFNVAFGLDDRRNRDVFAGPARGSTQLKNQTFSVNSIYRISSNFLLSVEYRRLWTTYPGALSSNNHINLALGYLF